MERFLAADVWLASLWSLAVLLGMIGLGRGLGRLIDREHSDDAGWGLHAVWGMGVYLFVGAALAVCHLFHERVIALLIGVGLAALLWTTLRGSWQGWSGRARASAWWKAWPLLLVVGVIFATGLTYLGDLHPADDPPAYFYFCEKLLSTGSFDEPFSWRRQASLGGHTLLQCSVLARTTYSCAETFEIALCPIILLGLIVGFRRGAAMRSPLGFLIALAAITTPILRANATSHLTGTVLLVGLYGTLDFADRLGAAHRRRLQWLALAGLVAAALCSLRAQYVPAAVGAMGLFWLGTWIRDRRSREQALIDLACWVGALLVALLPWMIMAYRSNGTPLFPLFQGNNNPDFHPHVANLPLVVRLREPVHLFLHPVLAPLLLCLAALPGWRRDLPARAVAVAAVVASLLLAYSVQLAPDVLTIPRYVQPLLLAGSTVALLAGAVAARSRVVAWAMTILVLGLSLPNRAGALAEKYAAFRDGSGRGVPYGRDDIVAHRLAQKLIPEGKRILVCSDFPLLLDLQRNPVSIIDLPHGTSPEPGLPFQQPPAATARYLRDQGIEYLIFVDFSKSFVLYNRAIWEKNATGRIAIWKIQSPFYFDFFDTMGALAATETTLGKVGNLTVVKLRP